MILNITISFIWQVLPEKISDGAGSLWSLITQSHLRLIDLQRETEREISHIGRQ